MHLNKCVYVHIYICVHMCLHTHTPTYIEILNELDVLLEQIHITKFIQVGIERNIIPKPSIEKLIKALGLQ